MVPHKKENLSCKYFGGKDGIWSEWGRGLRIKEKFWLIEEVLEGGGLLYNYWMERAVGE